MNVIHVFNANLASCRALPEAASLTKHVAMVEWRKPLLRGLVSDGEHVRTVRIWIRDASVACHCTCELRQCRHALAVILAWVSRSNRDWATWLAEREEVCR